MNVFLIPNGIKNLQALFPAVPWSDVAEYYVEALDNGGNVVGASPLNILDNCCSGDKVRVHFLNYVGGFDAINFGHVRILNDAKSSEYKKPLRRPLQKTDTGIERLNVRANDFYECKTTSYGEKQMDWCMELLNSPKAFIEWEGKQGQSSSFLPIKIDDVKFEKKKDEERYVYELTLQFRLSNEKVIVRN